MASFLQRVLDAAEQHGKSSEPDMEIGDLQMLARTMWALLTPAQRAQLADDDDLKGLIEWWPTKPARAPRASGARSGLDKVTAAILRGKP